MQAQSMGSGLELKPPPAGPLSNFDKFFPEREPVMEKLNLSEYSHTPRSLKMTSPFNERIKPSNSNTAGGAKDNSFSRYDNLRLGDTNEHS